MSIPKRMTVNCPGCKKQYETTVFESLNTDFAPDIIETVISGDRFAAKCPRCGFVAHLEYDVLYHDIKHRAMIWVVHNNAPDYSTKVAEIKSTHLSAYEITRIVPDMNALREKAACLEAGKDDRIIELCKVFLATKLKQQEPDFNLKTVFYTFHEGRDIVFFYDTNGKELACDLDNELYRLISDSFNKRLAQMKSAYFQIIDYNWALGFFEKMPADKSESTTSIQSEGPDTPDKKCVSEVAPSEIRSGGKKALFCRKCGEKLLSDSLFCSYCGTKVVY